MFDVFLMSFEIVLVFFVVSGMGPVREDKAEHIFRMFDHNHDGEVSFKELMSTLSLTTRGED